MDFENECDVFVKYHQKRRKGDRLERLANGLGHAETTFLRNVWWPLFHHFEHLHPEYEVRDYKSGSRYIDFAYILPSFRVAIEIDGVTTHWREITQSQFFEHMQRQNTLLLDGWHLVRFTYDTVKSQPRVCQQTIQQALGKWQFIAQELNALSIYEREIVRTASRSVTPLTPKDVSLLLGVSSRYARLQLHQLVEKRWLIPASGAQRYRSYRLHDSRSYIRW